MADPHEFDDVMPDLDRIPGGPPEKIEENIFARLISTLVIAVLMSLGRTALTVLTVIQFLFLLVNKGQPNARLAEFGTDLGIWIAKAARYLTAGSEVKPWPWTELD